MFLLYFYSSIMVLLTIYMIVERKKLLFYKEINQMKRQETYVAEIPVSIQKFIHSTATKIIPSINTKQSVLFEYRRLFYVATPLDDHRILVSRIKD